MDKREILDQLHCLLELCETQVGLPNTHPMWEKDVEALADVIEMLEQEQRRSVKNEPPSRRKGRILVLRMDGRYCRPNRCPVCGAKMLEEDPEK